MSLNIEEKQCKVCNRNLTSSDDAVFCPVCGAPHHRSCYNELGHCALEHLHGTENEYDSSAEEADKQESTARQTDKNPFAEDGRIKVKCFACGEYYDADNLTCPNCGTPNSVRMGGRLISIDFLGGVPSETDLGQGVTAEEAKRFVFSNTQRFIPKFARMREGKKASFNILAFFFPCAWALSRKMYKLGALLGAITVALTILVAPFRQTVFSAVPDEVKMNYAQFLQYISDNIEFFMNPALFVAFGASVLMIITKVVMAIFGDYFYRNHTINSVADIKKNSDDIDEDMRKKGGVSFLLLILGLLITEYLPAILLSFTQL